MTNSNLSLKEFRRFAHGKNLARDNFYDLCIGQGKLLITEHLFIVL